MFTHTSVTKLPIRVGLRMCELRQLQNSNLTVRGSQTSIINNIGTPVLLAY